MASSLAYFSLTGDPSPSPYFRMTAQLGYTGRPVLQTLDNSCWSLLLLMDPRQRLRRKTSGHPGIRPGLCRAHRRSSVVRGTYGHEYPPAIIDAAGQIRCQYDELYMALQHIQATGDRFPFSVAIDKRPKKSIPPKAWTDTGAEQKE